MSSTASARSTSGEPMLVGETMTVQCTAPPRISGP